MEKLGIEPILLVAQVVNFLIIVFVLSRLLYKPILDLLEKRRREIAEGLALTEKMRQEEEKLKLKREKVLDAARAEGQKILDEMRHQAKEEEKEILAAGHAEAQDIIAKGKEEVARLHEELAKNLRREAVGLAEAMVKRLLTKVLSSTDQHKLLDQELGELEKAKLS